MKDVMHKLMQILQSDCNKETTINVVPERESNSSNPVTKYLFRFVYVYKYTSSLEQHFIAVAKSEDEALDMFWSLRDSESFEIRNITQL